MDFAFVLLFLGGFVHCMPNNQAPNALLEEYIMAYQAAEQEKMESDGTEEPHTELQEALAAVTAQLTGLGYSQANLDQMFGITGSSDTKRSAAVSSSIEKRTYQNYASSRWTKGVVPYTYLDSMTPSGILETVRTMHTYERFTCMRFVPWEKDDQNVTTNMELDLGHTSYLKYMKADGCWSYVGNTRWANGQPLSCCGGTNCVHEVGHALGFHHEQNTPSDDRDWIIRINNDWIEKGNEHIYVKGSKDSGMTLGYDLSSYMHYKSWMFSGSGPTFTPLYPEMKDHNGFYYLMYEVSVSHDCQKNYCPKETLVCENEGYMDLIDYKCRCRCLPGLDPDTGCTKTLSSSTSTDGFPGGQYALPAPESGCPDSVSTTGHNVHFNDGGNKVSSPYNLKGDFTDKKIEEHFCVTQTADNEFRWPNGNYCIYRKGGKCPDKYHEEFVQYDDHPVGSDVNSATGDLPDGVFDQNTRLEFCCMLSGFSWEEMFLPNRKPIVLIKHPFKPCQPIRGMHVYEQNLLIENSEDEGIHNKSGMTPVRGYQAYDIDYCYYKPAMIDCGGVFEVNASNPSVTVESPIGAELDCSWYFKAPEGENLVLKFDEFSVEGTMGDCKDKVEIRYFRAGQEGFIYCGDSLHRSFQSMNNTFLIRLSTFGNTDSKFKATVSFIDKNELCYLKEDRGTTYVGKTNFTRNFEPCLPWTEMAHCPHHPGISSDTGSTLLDGNYCRNPDYNTGIKPWCYTASYRCARNYCDPCLLGTLYDKSSSCAELAAAGLCTDPQQKEAASKLCARTCGVTVETPTKIKSVTCPKPGSVLDGDLADPNGPSSYPVGATATYKCSTGDMTKQRYCLTDGSWSPLGLVCDYCPDGWIMKKDGDTRLCFKYLDKSDSLANHKKACQDLGGEILRPKSAEENDLMKSLISHSSWLDLTDTETEGTFVWGDGTPLNYSNWANGEPNNWNGGENCVAMYTSGLWNDVGCHNTYRAVCVLSGADVPVCGDFADKCDKWVQANATYCRKLEDFARRQCAYTCGTCDKDKTPKCSVPSVANADIENSPVSLSRGETAVYKCQNGSVEVGGDRERICLASGSISGQDLQCALECPAGWKYLDETKSCYKLFPKVSVTYAEAVAKCAKLNGVNVMMKTYSQHSFVYRIVNPASAWPWYGLTDIEVEGTFKWADGEFLALTYSRWASWEPDNWKDGEDCAYGDLWNDVSCTRKYPVMCQTKLIDFPYCADYEDTCEDSVLADPSYCAENSSIADVDCKFTCGRCDQDTTPKCPVPTLLGSSNDAGQDSVSRGDLVKFSCDNGNAALSGDTKRICLASGSLSGQDVKCVEDKMCSVPSLPNADTDGGQKSLSSGEKVVYTCQSGNVALSGDAERTCLVGGVLDGQDLQCVAECPTGWDYLDETKSCYKFFPEASMTYAEAVTKCAKLNGVNVMMKTYSQHEFLYSLANPAGVWPWYGLTDIEVEGTFKWADGELLSNTYSRWASWEPDNWNNDEDCVYNNVWNDVSCNTKRAVMCQTKVIDVPHCADYEDSCENSVLANPSYCVENSSIADVDCKFTCGKCDQDATPKCPVPTLLGTSNDAGQDSVSRGDLVEFSCDNGNIAVSGDTKRICLASGSLSGQELKCVKDIKCSVPSLQSADTDGGQTSLSIGEKVVYTCQSGKVPASGDTERTCLVGGVLDGQDVQCVAECPTGWDYLDETKSCYKFFPKVSMTYAEAVAKCAKLNGVNVMMKTYSQHEFLYSLANPAGVWPWYGLTDIEVEGTFKWADGELLSNTYSRWASWEPDNWNTGEDCVYNDVWNDVSCNTKRSVMCQTKVIDVPHCADYEDSCENSVLANPSYCVENSSIADVDCKFTCGKCDQHATPKCPVPTLLDTSNDAGEDSVSRGEMVEFSCDNGNIAASGDTKRICLASGSLSGQDLKCVEDKKCSVPSLQNADTDGGQTILSIGEKVVYTCQSGKVPASGDTERTCLVGGVLDGQDVQCADDCPSGWTYFAETKSCYKLFPVDQLWLNYADATAKCAFYNGLNVMPKTQTQFDFVYSLVYPEAWPWYGLTDKETEGTFKWSDNDPLTFTRWGSGEPNEWGSGEDCTYGNWWNDFGCSNLRPTMCQTKLSDFPDCFDIRDDCVALLTSDASLCDDPVSTGCRFTCGRCSVDSNCEPGWTYLRETDSCYKFFSGTSFKYAGAEEECKDHGGLIVMPKTETQFNFIVTLFDGLSASPWLGMTDRDTEGTYLWADGSVYNKDTAYGNWDYREPNNYGDGDGEDCISVTSSQKWNDLACGYGGHEAFCQKRKTPTR